MAHGNCESMRSRAFTKGRSAFDSDDEYRRALRGELDVREDFGYQANEDPDDGEAGDGEAGEIVKASEAAKAELRRYEKLPGFTRALERFMRDASGEEEPSYLPFPPIQDKEVLATFCNGSESLRLRYGAYGLAADRLEGLEVVETWRNLVGDIVLGEWDEMFAEEAEEAEEAELEKEDLEDRVKDEFFDDTMPAILADRERGAEFLDFVMDAVEGRLAKEPTRAIAVKETPDGRIWFGWDGNREFFLRRADVEDKLATWYTGESLDDLRVGAWVDPDARDFLLGGELKKTWDALDDAWYDEDEDGLVADSIEKFLAGVEDAKKDLRVGVVQRNVAVCDELDTGRVEMRMVWARTYPDTAELTYSRGGKEETFGEVPLAFLRWWKFCRERGW